MYEWITGCARIALFCIYRSFYFFLEIFKQHLEQTVIKLNLDPNTTFCQMNSFRHSFRQLLEWIRVWLEYGLMRLCGAFSIVNSWTASPGITSGRSCQTDSENWKTSEALRTYNLADGGETMVTVQTSSCAFHVSSTSV